MSEFTLFLLTFCLHKHNLKWHNCIQRAGKLFSHLCKKNNNSCDWCTRTILTPILRTIQNQSWSLQAVSTFYTLQQ